MQGNPVVYKELKIKMRGWKSPALITAYIGFLTLVIFLMFLSNNQFARYGTGGFNPRTAISSYNTLAAVQFFLIMLITPVLTAGVVSSERERQTLDLLLCTNLSPFSIISGKLLVSIAHIILLVTTSLPVMGLVFLFGGVSLSDLLLLFLFYLVTATMVGCMGVFYSTVFKKSATAMIMCYITMFILSVGTIIIFYIWAFLSGAVRASTPPDAWIIMLFMLPNPVFAYLSIMESTMRGGFNIMYELTRLVSGQSVPWYLSKPWILNMVFNIVLGVIFILAATWKLNPLRNVGTVRAIRFLKKKKGIKRRGESEKNKAKSNN